MKNEITSIDHYFSAFEGIQLEKLMQIRTLLKVILPNAKECISYGIPTFKQEKNIVHFAAFNNHIGFYPGAKAVEIFKDELTNFKTSKGTIQFNLHDDLPTELIKKITLFNLNLISKK